MSEATLEQRAKEMGWRPREEFHGHPDHFVDAETYVRRGEEVLPLVKRENEGLRTELTNVRGQLSAVEAALMESRTAMEEFAKFQSDLTADRVKAAREKLIGELVEAKKEGNVEDEVRLADELADLKAAERQPPLKVAERREPDGANNPIFQAWVGENPWYLSDPEKQRAALAYGVVLRGDPETKGLTGKPFLDMVKAHVEKVYGGTNGRTSVDKVEAGRGTGGYGGGGGGKGYNDLPAEAREVVTRQATRFVGENKMFKDMKAWQDHYAKTYFADEG